METDITENMAHTLDDRNCKHEGLRKPNFQYTSLMITEL